jgi:hypothetical protein
MDHRLILFLSMGLMAMPLLITCIVGIIHIRKRVTVRLARKLGIVSLGIILFNLITGTLYNASFEFFAAHLMGHYGHQVYAIFDGFYSVFSSCLSALAIALMLWGICVKAKTTNV